MKLKKKLVDATRLSKRTVDLILARSALLEMVSLSPQGSATRRVDPDYFAIWRTVHQFYDQRTYPTLCKLHFLLKERGLFSAGRTSLWKLLQEKLTI